MAEGFFSPLVVVLGAGRVAPVQVYVPPVGFYLPDWGQEYIRMEMAEDRERAGGMPRRSDERPPSPTDSSDWGQIILGERLEADEEER